MAKFSFKAKVLNFIHDDHLTDHSGHLKMYQRANRDFVWDGIKKTLNHWFRNVTFVSG